jgi:hypothetical protein
MSNGAGLSSSFVDTKAEPMKNSPIVHAITANIKGFPPLRAITSAVAARMTPRSPKCTPKTPLTTVELDVRNPPASEKAARAKKDSVLSAHRWWNVRNRLV